MTAVGRVPSATRLATTLHRRMPLADPASSRRFLAAALLGMTRGIAQSGPASLAAHHGTNADEFAVPIVGSSRVTNPVAAALVNGASAGAAGLGSRSPGLPAAAAAVVSGSRIQPLMTVGDVDRGLAAANDISMLLVRRGRHRGWDESAPIGGFASAAALSVALGLEPDVTARALTVVSSLTSTLAEHAGTPVGDLHEGIAARHGLRAVLLARGGMAAASDALEAINGAGEVFFGLDHIALEERIDALGEIGAAPIPVSRCAIAGTGEDALERLAELNPDPGSVVGIDVDGVPFDDPAVRFETPDSPSEARYCLPHAVATELWHGSSDIATLIEALDDPRVAATARSVRLGLIPRWAPEYMYGPLQIRIAVRSADGTTQSTEHGVPLSEDPRVAEFTDDLVAAPTGITAQEAIGGILAELHSASGADQ